MNYPQNRRGKMSNYSKDEAIKELQKKLEIEKAKFDKFVEELKKELRHNVFEIQLEKEDGTKIDGCVKDVKVMFDWINNYELSSKQEEDK
jgi:Leu/Phe-tRNA-protein transferase